MQRHEPETRFAAAQGKSTGAQHATAARQCPFSRSDEGKRELWNRGDTRTKGAMTTNLPRASRIHAALCHPRDAALGFDAALRHCGTSSGGRVPSGDIPVSYTHLTLPTSDL